MRYTLLGVFCVFLIFNASQTLAVDTFCQETKTLIVFGNGIMNSEPEADRSKNRLQELLQATLTPDEFKRLEFAIAYNQSYGLLRDLYESLKQKLGADNVVTSFWRWLGGRDILPDAVQQEFLRVAASFDFSTRVGTQDLSIHLALYRSKTLEGKKIVVVSHSQGNFFVNAAYVALHSGTDPLTTNSFGVVSVANPASFVAGSGPYTTLFEDGVIAAIRAATVPGIQPPLIWNLTNILSGARTSDWKGHGFLDEYTAAGSRSVNKILPDVIATMNGLQQPPQTVQDGIITATLTWGAQPDVDLHAYEPNSTHVYYAHLQGISGRLDLDDVTSFGPEHYFVSCSKLETGTYRIGVNYYSGSGPETAQIQILAGSSVRNYTVPLPSARGSSGDQSPIPVASITVTGDTTNGYKFDIVGGL